jgi:hypothetical protein
VGGDGAREPQWQTRSPSGTFSRLELCWQHARAGLLSLTRRWAKPQQQHRSAEQQQQHRCFAGCAAELALATLQPHENPAMG